MCRLIPVAAVLMLMAPTLRAQDAKAATLTPKQIADGWIHLFYGETTFGWKGRGPGGIGGGEWTIGGEVEGANETTTSFADGVLSLEYRQIGKQYKAELLLQGQRVGLLGVSNKATWIAESFVVKQGKMSRTSTSPAGRADSFPVETDKMAPGPIGFVVPRGSQLAVRNVKFRPNAGQILFNGKDLASWKVFPGKKSEFAVIDGAINIKNGPGDLQTAKAFGDFCLQLECISNGPHLNSGVFFRCRPGEYQNGYEAQVRNEFKDKPTQKYLLEEYDPQTHKLVAKKEAVFSAVDFGTGAIYRRQPARKEMSKDKEWFTMTIVAHGNHFATWVNGVQVTDWHDNRPPADNARNGYRAEAGHISLQGHDPTTDLSFRNFRIQEYPK